MNYKQILETRFACKDYVIKPLTEDEEKFILDCGRLTPSSFGLEAWHVYAISRRTREDLFEPMYRACFSQYSVKSSAFITVLTYKKKQNYEANTDLIKNRALRFDGGLEAFELDFRNFFNSIKDQDEWSKAQTYLLGMNMAMAASSIGIESCILEGYSESEVAKLLNLNLDDEGIGLVIPFGYPNEKMKGKIRLPLDEFASYI